MYFIKLFLVPLAAVLIICLFLSNTPAGQQENSKTAGNVKVENDITGSFSIFAGALADLSWLEVENATEEDSLAILPAAISEKHSCSDSIKNFN